MREREGERRRGMRWTWAGYRALLLLIVALSCGSAAALEEGAGRSYHVLLASVHELSHVKPLTALAKELVQRGHRVTFAVPESCLVTGPESSECLVTTSSWMAAQVPKAHYLPAGSAVPFSQREVELAALAERRPLRAVLQILSMMSDMNEPLLATLLHTYQGAAPEDLPDLIVVDTLSHAAVDAAERLGLPVIFNNPLPLWHDLLEPQGMMVPVHAFPRTLGSLTTFTGRIGNFLEHLIWLAIGVHGAMLRNSMRGRHGLGKLGYTPQLALRSSATERDAWIIQNTVFGLDVPRLMEPRVFMVGPVRPSSESDGCTGSARDCRTTLAWVNNKARKTRPLLYVNVGMNHPPAPSLAEHVLQALSTFSSAHGVDVLWAMDEASRRQLLEQAATAGAGLLVSSAVPEETVLSHPRVVAVVSHCSFEAISHALAKGLPIVGLPTRGNQAGLCTMAQNAGAAQCCLSSSINKWAGPRQLEAALHEVLVARHGHYKANAERLARVMRVAGGTDRAADLVELALTSGLGHVKDSKRDLDWFVGSMADVRLGMFAILLLVYCTLTLGLRLVRRLARRVMKVYKDLGSRSSSSSDRDAAKDAVQQNGSSAGGSSSSNGDAATAAAPSAHHPHHD